MISIIVPIYKVEQFLPDCIESIIAQTHQDWECILVDDGSPDKSGIIADEYAKKDPRIKVFHRQNRGVSVARNYGIEKASGEWIMFVDSDDLLTPDFVAALFEEVQMNPEIQYVDAGCQEFAKERNSINKVKRNKPYFGEDWAYLFSHFNGPVWSSLFFRDIIVEHGIKFDENLRMDEDVIFNIEYMSHIHCYCLSPEVGYLYRQNPSGAMRTIVRSYEECYNTFLHYKSAINGYIKSHGNSISSKDVCYKRLGGVLMWTIESLYTNSIDKKNRISKIKSDYTREDFRLLKHYRGRIDNKLLSMLLYFGYFRLYDITAKIVIWGRGMMRRLTK